MEGVVPLEICYDSKKLVIHVDSRLESGLVRRDVIVAFEVAVEAGGLDCLKNLGNVYGGCYAKEIVVIGVPRIFREFVKDNYVGVVPGGGGSIPGGGRS